MTFCILACSSVEIIEDNKALRRRMQGVALPKIKQYTVESDGYGKLFDRTEILL